MLYIIPATLDPDGPSKLHMGILLPLALLDKGGSDKPGNIAVLQSET